MFLSLILTHYRTTFIHWETSNNKSFAFEQLNDMKRKDETNCDYVNDRKIIFNYLLIDSFLFPRQRFLSSLHTHNFKGLLFALTDRSFIQSNFVFFTC